MVKVKICGLQDQHTVDAVCEFGANFIGFVFARSKRQVSPMEVLQMTKNVPKQVKKVGVFVSPTLAEIEATVALADLDYIQIHRKRPAGKFPKPLIKAENGESFQTILVQEDEFLLLDAPATEFVGGNGKVFNWKNVAQNSLPKERLFIAGGLDAENVAQAIATFQPYAVDVSSGVETNGTKDLTKIAAFIKVAKGI